MKRYLTCPDEKFNTTCLHSCFSENGGFELLEELIYNNEITVPKGFITKLESTPSGLFLLLGADSKYLCACIVHDYLYATSYRNRMSRKQADKLLLKALIELGAPGLRAHTVYHLTRLFKHHQWLADCEKQCTNLTKR